jgi:multiple sugar transport system permease protein
MAQLTTAPEAVGLAPTARGRPYSGRRLSARSGAALHRQWWVPYIWLLPSLAGIGIFGIFPFLQAFYLSFTSTPPLGGDSTWVGLANYVTMLKDSEFWLATRNSVLYTVIVVPLMVMLPLLLAVLVERQIPFIGFFRSIFYTPVVASMVVVGLMWSWLLQDQGLINTVLRGTHLVQHSIPFLSNSWLLLFSAMGITLWKGLGWYMVFYLVALANVPKELHEAAEIDGANAPRRFLHITLPGVKAMMLLVGTFSAIGCMRVFTEVYVLSGSTGGPGGRAETLPFYIRSAGLDPSSGDAGYGAAISVVLFLMTLGFAVLARRLAKGDEPS